MATDYELDDAALMRRMQMRRLGIVEDILDEKDEASGAPVKANRQDPKMLKIALTAMTDIDKSIINRQRIDLETKAAESDEAQGAIIAGAIKQVLAAGGLALRTDQPGTPQQAQPQIDQSMLPQAAYKDGETRQGEEHIEYEDIMNPGEKK
jgi:hypothetical protein